MSRIADLTPAQCRMARAGLKMSRRSLASAARVSTATLADFESGKRTPYDRTLRDIKKALEDAGVEFVDAGARLIGEALK